MNTPKPNAIANGHFFVRPLFSLFCSLGLLITPLTFAQEDASDEIFELSPFTIKPEEGWIATETLAGSRLRTDFKDVAAQVEVFTMEFMEDYGINSMEESLIYSMNVASPEDRVAGNGNGFGRSPFNFNQIRGIGGGTRSRNFFKTITPTENYSISRLTIASGPQSILFGTGAPAGVLDVTLKRAETSEDFGTVSFQTDSNGSHRVAFDYNKVIVEDVLALRVAAVDKNTEQDWEPNHDELRGYYGTVTWKPFENTTIMGHYERQERDYNRANRFLPFDQASPWFGWGQPGFDINTLPVNDDGDIIWRGIQQNATLDDRTINPEAFPLIYDRGPQQPHILINADGSWEQPTTMYRNMVTVTEPVELPGVSPVNYEADNWTLIDNSVFPKALDVNLGGVAEKNVSDSDIYNVFLEQKLADNWFFEFAYNNEEEKRFTYETNIWDRTIKVDPNLFLADGVTPNPHFGDFYVDGRPGWQPNANFLEHWRATMSYEFDFNDHMDNWMKWFGRHRLAALISEDKETLALGQQGYRYRFLPDFDTLEEPFFANSNFPPPIGNRVRRWGDAGSRGLHVRHYLTEENNYTAVASDLTFDGRPITVMDENGKSWTIDPNNTGYVDEHGQRLVSNNAPQGIKTELDTVQFGYQGFFWNGNIALTYGWRKDKAKSANFINVARDDSRNPVHPNGAHGTGLYPHVDDVEFGDFGDEQSGITRTKGAVVRPLSWLSLFWNESDTFQPNIGRFDPYGTEYPGAEGEGEDYGFRLDLFDDKLTLRWNEFEMLAGPSRAANTPFNRWRDPVWTVANRYRTITGLDDYPGAGQGAFRERGRCCYWVMSDNLSEGTEISANYRPIDGLDVRLTYTDRTAIESNIGNIWFQWIDERLADSWTTFSVPEGGVGDPRDLNENGVIDTWTWETAWRTDTNEQTLAAYYQNIVVNGPIGASLIQALDGKPNEFDRSESANLNVNYRFQEGRLRGWSAGFAIRYRGAPAVGFRETSINGIRSPDLDRVIDGATDMTYDVTLGHRGTLKLFGERNYRARLNIRNLFDDGPTFPVIKSVDGNNIRVARKAGRLFVLSFDVDL